MDAHERAAAPEPARLDAALTWIWGSPRSGSTWLLKLLSWPLLPDPEQPLGIGELPAGGPFDVFPFDETFISNHLAPAFADPRQVEDRWTPGTLNNLLAGAKPTYVFSQAQREIWEPAAREFIRARLGGVIARARVERVPLVEEPAVVIKETNGSHAADLVMGLLPSSRLLLLIRDGRDVVDSLLAAYQPGGFFARSHGRAFTTEEERREGVLWAARKWACNTEVTLQAIERHPPELCRTVRYEDLLTDTTGELARTFDWIGVERDAAAVEEIVAAQSFSRIPEKERGPLTRNRAASPGLWRENLSREEQDIVDRICGPLLERFGYAR